MKTTLITLAVAGFLAAPLGAQSTTGTANMSPRATANQSNKATPVNTKVSPSLAASVRVSADSAMEIARVAGKGEVSSVDLELKRKRLVYEVKVLNKSKRATEVQVDAMTGEVIRNKQYGGLKATTVHHKENKKLLDAKRDSMRKNP